MGDDLPENMSEESWAVGEGRETKADRHLGPRSVRLPSCRPNSSEGERDRLLFYKE